MIPRPYKIEEPLDPQLVLHSEAYDLSGGEVYKTKFEKNQERMEKFAKETMYQVVRNTMELREFWAKREAKKRKPLK